MNYAWRQGSECRFFSGGPSWVPRKSRDNGFSSIHTKAAVFSKTRKRFLLFDFRVNMKSLTFSNKIKIYCGLNILFSQNLFEIHHKDAINFKCLIERFRAMRSTFFRISFFSEEAADCERFALKPSFSLFRANRFRIS